MLVVVLHYNKNVIYTTFSLQILIGNFSGKFKLKLIITCHLQFVINMLCT